MTFASRETSVCSGQPYELYLFQTDADRWWLTSSDEAKSYLGETYTPTAITRTQTSQTSELSSGALTVQVPKDHAIAEMFIQYLPPSPLFVTIYRAHAGEDESETVVHFVGKVTSAKFGDFCDLNCVPEQQTLKKTIPAARYQKPCNRILYDPGCGVSKDSYVLTDVLTSVDVNVVQAAIFATKPDDWLTTGYLEKGLERRQIIAHVGDTLTLLYPMPGLIVGDSVRAFAGCQRDYDTCVTKFANGSRFFGFQWVPGKNPFNGLG